MKLDGATWPTPPRCRVVGGVVWGERRVCADRAVESRWASLRSWGVDVKDQPRASALPSGCTVDVWLWCDRVIVCAQRTPASPRCLRVLADAACVPVVFLVSGCRCGYVCAATRTCRVALHTGQAPRYVICGSDLACVAVWPARVACGPCAGARRVVKSGVSLLTGSATSLRRFAL